MKYITCQHDLELYIPNFVTEVEGERSIFDKIQPRIRNAEAWLETTITGGIEIGSHLFRHCRDIVAGHALMSAIDALDLILTPSGIGVVSTETISPASAARMEAMRKSMRNLRDGAIILLVDALRTNSEWRHTIAGRRFFSSLIPIPSLQYYGIETEENTFAEWQSKSAQLSDIEEALAEHTISAPVLAYLRDVQETSGTPEGVKKLIKSFRSCALAKLRGEEIDRRMMEALIDIARTNSDTCALWVDSRAGEVHTLPIFQNKPKNGAFFF